MTRSLAEIIEKAYRFIPNRPDLSLVYDELAM